MKNTKSFVSDGHGPPVLFKGQREEAGVGPVKAYTPGLAQPKERTIDGKHDHLPRNRIPRGRTSGDGRR